MWAWSAFGSAPSPNAAAWREIVRSNPFPDEARDDPSHLVVLLLKSAPRAGGVEALRTGITGRERVAAGTRALYLVYPDGIGRSKVTNIRIERAIGVLYLPDTERRSHYFQARVSDQFDAVIHVDSTHALEPLERTAHWDALEVAETYPSGL